MKYEEDKRYYHVEYCHGKYLKLKAETVKENQEWDNLYQYIIKLHDILLLPKGNITRLKDLRAGYETKNGKRERKWRTGPDFGLMLDAYVLAEDSIKWNLTNTLDGSNDVRAINYCISIMIGKLNEAFARRKNRIEQMKIIKKTTNQDKEIISSSINNKIIKKDDMDISDFL
ncbi:hypothetical protein [Paenibacillus sp. 1781tsa1]|uniref:hypothetical protein n=1 Tax=Paenibacillus sp. 1781tsa1 TaxID=2953810 RepID=UPI00209CB3E9|nr:hypothetical protein [Paenibacillus sp. 1781tsa1]MCP1184960.1 hypothetical protein [Paenibacillus sp. 1781tsa1]